MKALPTQAPDITGQLGKAWRIDLPAFRAKHNTPPDQDSSIGFWIVHAPYAHPVWHSYMIGCIHLRDIPGQSKPPTINLPGATHECIVMALDPKHDIVLGEQPRYLYPANFCGQFIEESDDSAVERMHRTVVDVCDGSLNPDTDYIQLWMRRFSPSNIKGDPRTAGQTVVTIEAEETTVVGTGASVTRQLEQGVLAGVVASIREDGADLVIPPKPAPND